MNRTLTGLLIIAGLVSAYSLYEGVRIPTEFAGVTAEGEFRGPLLSGRGWRAEPGTRFWWETKSCFGEFVREESTFSAVCKGRVFVTRGVGIVGLRGEMTSLSFPGVPDTDGMVSPEFRR